MELENENMSEKVDRILAIDVGSGTQDILIYESDKTMENCVQIIAPSQTVLVGKAIARATAQGKDVFLHGQLMGGGASSSAVRDHLAAGLKVFATPVAARTIRDNLDDVRSMGVQIVHEAPAGAVGVEMKDVDLEALSRALAVFDVELPGRYAIAVQDHGYSPHQSNRKFRFEHLKRFVDSGGRIEDLAYTSPPEYLTRMRAVQETAPGAIVMDTGSAAVWGALCDPVVAKAAERGVIIVNVGNEHTIGILLAGHRVWGLFEHHTHCLDTSKLGRYVLLLRAGKLTNEEVFDDGGHGCFIHPAFQPAGFDCVAVTGPNRDLAQALGYYLAAPYGDMMLTGCFGLVSAAKAKLGLK